MSNLIGFIGTRNISEVPKEGLDLYKRAAEVCNSKGYILVTGAAKGADQLAAEICLESGGMVKLYLPWMSYEKVWVDELKAKYQDKLSVSWNLTKAAQESVINHPNVSKLSDAARTLMARNYMIVYQCRSVIAIPRPPMQGGTAQGIRLCQKLNIPVFNLSVTEGQESFSKYL
jgi:predicted Rossmann fold nucleotide-binding protein DprA/Smf involved in DNA uptake